VTVRVGGTHAHALGFITDIIEEIIEDIIEEIIEEIIKERRRGRATASTCSASLQTDDALGCDAPDTCMCSRLGG